MSGCGTITSLADISSLAMSYTSTRIKQRPQAVQGIGGPRSRRAQDGAVLSTVKGRRCQEPPILYCSRV